MTLRHLLYLLVILACAAAGYAINAIAFERQKSEQEIAATRASAQVAAYLERNLLHNVHVTEAVRAMFEAQPQLPQSRFTSIAAELTRGMENVVNVAAAPGRIIEYVHPFEPNRSALGLDLAEFPQFQPSIEKAIRTGEVTIDGPVDIVQGGTALITRAAVKNLSASDDVSGIWGIVSLVIDQNQLLTSAAAEVERDGFDVAITDLTGSLLHGADDFADQRSMATDLSFAGLTWQVAVAPAGGWVAVSTYRTEIWLLVSIAGLIGLALVHWLGRTADRTHRAEKQLEEAIDALEDGFALYDNDDRLILCNARYRDFYSSSAEAIVPGATFEDILRYGLSNGQYFDAIGREEEWLGQRLEAHQRSGIHLEQPLADGRWLRVVERKTPSGNIVGFRVDITELKDALENSEAASRSKSTFLNTISHELRTPLTVVLGYNAFVRYPEKLPSFQALAVAIDKNDKAAAAEGLAAFRSELQRFGRQIDASGQQLMALISGILDLAAVEEGSVSLDLERIDLAQIVVDVTEQFRPLAEKKGIALSNEATPVEINVDPLRLRQILFNLVGNALKFTEEGSVTIRTGYENGEPWIEVEDTGAGIAPEHVDTIFDRFTQVGDSTSHGNAGVGLGLSISRELAHMHGGDLTVRSVEGAGSTFRLQLKNAIRLAHDAA